MTIQRPLKALIQAASSLSAEERREIIRQITEALDPQPETPEEPRSDLPALVGALDLLRGGEPGPIAVTVRVRLGSDWINRAVLIDWIGSVELLPAVISSDRQTAFALDGRAYWVITAEPGTDTADLLDATKDDVAAIVRSHWWRARHHCRHL